MAIEFTCHGGRPREIAGGLVDVLDGQDGDSVTVALGAVSGAVACRVRIGAGLEAGDAADTGEPWPIAPCVETRFLNVGDMIAVDAL